MGLTWSFNSDATGYKVLQATVSNGVAGTGIVEKFDGSIVNPVADSTSFTDGDQQYLSTTDLYLSVSDTDSGWTDAMTGTEITSDFIDGYMNGWVYTGDGTTHSWEQRNDSAVTSTDPTFVANPTNAHVDWTPNNMSYQLANEVEEDVSHLVEGSLSIQGDAQVTVGSGFSYTEDSEGKRTYTITPEDQRYNETVNIVELPVWYNSSLKSTVQSTVTKTSDIATDVSILDRQMLDVLIRLDALESGGTS